MKFSEMLKKYWFVGLVCILLLVFVGAYAASSIKNKETTVNSLSKDGKDVIYSLNGDTYFYADDLYEELYKDYGGELGFITLFHELVNEYEPTTDELNTMAANYATSMLEQYGEESLGQQLVQSGYRGIEDVNDYCLFALKYQNIVNELYVNQADKNTQPVIDEENPRYISHILILVSDIETITDEEGNTTYKLNPTEEETKKLEECQAEIAKDDKAFGEIAQEYSEDPGSAENGGYLGLVYKSYNDYADNPYVEEFLTGSLQADKELGEPLVVESRYGYHIIKAETPSIDELMSDSTFYNIILSYNPNLIFDTVNQKYEELGFEIFDENVQYVFDLNKEGE